jgi:hypothetical protein
MIAQLYQIPLGNGFSWNDIEIDNNPATVSCLSAKAVVQFVLIGAGYAFAGMTYGYQA